MTSYAASAPPSDRWSRRSSRGTCANVGSAASAVDRLTGASASRTTTRVTMPSVPSEPTNSCLRSYPALFLTIRLSDVITVPSASTASRPSTLSRVIP